MREEFKKRRGYDPTPYLLTLTGRLVEDGPTTDRFLWDFRWTVTGKHVRVPITLAPEKSILVVFRNPGKPEKDPTVFYMFTA